MSLSSTRRRLVVTTLVLAGALAVALALVAQLVRHGVSARDAPTAAEAAAARVVRRLATPSDARAMANPLPNDADNLAGGRAHFADHCAVCHGNDGKGQTAIGRNLYPRAPDMTAEQTQGLTDGELFFIITNGIRLTGMPAWGARTAKDDRETWQLVHFLRSLPTLTADQVEEMKALNPKSRAELDEEQEERRWLAGDDAAGAKVGEPPH